MFEGLVAAVYESVRVSPLAPLEGVFSVWCYIFFFLLGLIIGSFLNVVVYRLHTGKTLQGRSRCLSCGKDLRWWHLVPVFSYLALRARCGHCGARISLRYSAVELLTGLLFLFVAYTFSGISIFPHLILISALVLIIVYDMLHTIIPDEFIILTSITGILIMATDFFLLPDVYMLAYHLLGGAVGFLFFAFLWFVSKGRWVGFGDAKLAIPLGFIVGWPGVLSMIMLSFWIGAAVGLTLLGLVRCARALHNRGQMHLRLFRNALTMKSEIPFAPFLIVGFLLVQFLSVDVFLLVSELLGRFIY